MTTGAKKEPTLQHRLKLKALASKDWNLATNLKLIRLKLMPFS